MTVILRDYQFLGRKLLGEKLAQDFKKIIYWLQTGGGKGLAMSDLARNAKERNKKTLVIMRRQELIKQTAKNFKRYHQLDTSIIMGSFKGFDPSKNIQISSIDTLTRRYKNPDYEFLKDFDIVQVDEMQDTTSKGYRNVFEWLGDKIFIGFTATPYAVGNKVHDFWETYIKPIEAHELRDRGFLTPVKIFRPTKIDTSGLKTIGGDYDNVELFDRVSKLSVIGDIVDNYINNGKNKPAILFAVNKKHSIIMAEAFRKKGITAVHIDESHSSDERDAAIEGSRRGKHKVVCNVNIFSTGVDMPWVEVEISARPSQSEILVCQQWGRVLRPFKECARCQTAFGAEEECPVCGSCVYRYEKQNAIIFDHAGNCDRHGYPYDIREAELTKEGKKKKKKKLKERPVPTVVCDKCFAIYEPSQDSCPECGWIRKKPNNVNEEDGELREVSEEERDNEFVLKINKFIKGLKWRVDNYNAGGDKYIGRKIFEKYGIHAIRLIDRINLNEYQKQELRHAQKSRLIQSASNLAKANSLGAWKRVP